MDIPDGNESNIISVTLSVSGNKSLGINLSVFKVHDSLMSVLVSYIIIRTLVEPVSTLSRVS